MLCADIAWDSISHDQNDSAPHAGEAIEKTLAWAESEVEGFMRT
jgi:hypothetical protein